MKLKENLDHLSNVTIVFILFTLITVVCFFVYISGEISFLVFRAIFFLYVLVLFIVGLRIHTLSKIKELSVALDFELITPFYLQPKIEGTYKKNWFQVHYVSKETGRDPGVLRTYVKLQYKKKKRFNTEKLKKYSNYDFGKDKIIVVKHIERKYKNYLLLKRSGYTFDKSKITALMDFLLKVAKESELN